MKSIQNQYRDLKEGKMSQANFMRNVRMTFPNLVTNVTSFDDSIRILRNKGLLSESIDQWESDFISDLKDRMIDPSQAEEILIKAKQDLQNHGETLKSMYGMFTRPFGVGAFLGDYAPQQYKKISETINEAKTKLHPNQIHPQELRMGIKVEMEHTDDPKKAEKIALDHLAENPFYYTALKLSGVESPSAPKTKAPAKVKAKKEEVMLIDKENQMKTPKGIEKVKASANKAHKETNKGVKGVEELTHTSKKAKGIKQVMSPTGGKMKTIREALNVSMPDVNWDNISKGEKLIKALSTTYKMNSDEIHATLVGKYGLTDKEANIAMNNAYHDKYYNEGKVKENLDPDRLAQLVNLLRTNYGMNNNDIHATLVAKYNLTDREANMAINPPLNTGTNLGSSFDKFKSKLREMVREVLNEYYDGRDNLTDINEDIYGIAGNPSQERAMRMGMRGVNKQYQPSSLDKTVADEAFGLDRLLSQDIDYIVNRVGDDAALGIKLINRARKVKPNLVSALKTALNLY